MARSTSNEVIASFPRSPRFNDNNDQVLRPESKDSGNLTPEAVLDNPATNDRIARTKPKVNRDSKKSSDERFGSSRE